MQYTGLRENILAKIDLRINHTKSTAVLILLQQTDKGDVQVIKPQLPV